MSNGDVKHTMSLETATGPENKPTTMVSLNGAGGRIALGVLEGVFSDDELGGQFEIDEVNFSGANSPGIRDLGKHLPNDPIYGLSRVVEQVEWVDTRAMLNNPKRTGDLLSKSPLIHFKDGRDEVFLRATAQPIAADIEWRAAPAGKQRLVMDASTLKMSSDLDPRRYPTQHLTEADIAIVTSPFEHPDVMTVVYGVNADSSAIADHLRTRPDKKGAFATSSCSTTNIILTLAAIAAAGYEVVGLDGTIVHAKTQSDNTLAFTTVAETTSGSQKELERLMRFIGPTALDFMNIKCVRVPAPVGSVSSLVVHVKGAPTSEDVLNSMSCAVANHEQLRQVVDVRRAIPVDSVNVKGQKFGAIIDGTTLSVERRAGSDESTVSVLSGFDNERGYLAATMRAALTIAQTRAEMLELNSGSC
jgi:glyceraldehyde-3-phosphate dehydrogenase/erythrose-4-phosphate dehydrogenase